MNTAFKKFDLHGKTALVTGGATGIGYHMTRALAQAGAQVMIAARRRDVLKQAADTLMQDPLIDRVHWQSADLNDRGSISALAAHANATMGGVDIFIGNAAATATEQLQDIDMKTVDSLMQLNLAANIQLAQAFLPRMKERRWGRLIFSSSIGSVMAAPLQGTIAYSTTKGALNALARGIAGDMGHHGITANALVLGFFMTELVVVVERQIREAQGADAARQFLAQYSDSTALGRMAQPEEIEGIIQLLASDAGSYITGATLAIDGGMSMMMRPLPLEQ